MSLHFLLDGPEDAATAARVGDDVVVSGAEAHHAATVRRVHVGELITLGDGRGTWLTGTSARVSTREVSVRVTARREVPAPTPRLVLAQALAKGDRDELAIQAATELGVDEIVPWQAARSIPRWDDAKAPKGRLRWTRIVREAAKQAHRAWVPDVVDLEVLSDLTARAQASRVIVLDPTSPVGLRDCLQGDGDVVLVVGPEGGISDDEMAVLDAAGARRAVLGDTVLRTSTAGPAALAVASVLVGRW